MLLSFSTVAAQLATQPAMARPQVDTPATVSSVVRLDLTGPVPVASVLDAASASNLEVTELWLTGDVTGYFNVSNLDRKEVVSKYTVQVAESYGNQVPSVVTAG